MKRIIILTVCITGLIQQGAIAQRQAINDGENILSAYYGVNLVKVYYKSELQGRENLSISGTGPVGFVFEHVITKKFGFGAEVGYDQTVASFDETGSVYSPRTNTYGHKSYTDKITFTSIRAQLRMNFHFVTTKNWDVYSILNAGYRSSTSTFETDNPEGHNSTSASPLPIGVKSGIGLRYFSQNCGMYTEVALGTPFMNFGLCFKL